MGTKTSAPSLVVRTGAGERILAAGRAYLIGRDPQADIAVADVRVSWHHAELRPASGRWALADLGSSNGSYADGRRADLIEIDGQRQVRLGDPVDGPVLDCAVRDDTAGETRRIGRSPDNDIVVPHVSVSSHHAELRATAGGYRIVDLESHNGTFVNEQRVTAVALAEGDTVGFGDTTFRLVGSELRELAAPTGAQMAPVSDPMAETALGAAAGAGPSQPRQMAPAASRSRFRTRCAGWCRGASGSRTSTS